MQITDLGGHSGCKILLCEDESNFVFVRKVSSSGEYNARLAAQARKQMAFAFPSIRAPKVYREGYTEDGLFFFDMEHIQGITLSEYMKSIRIGDIKRIVETLVCEISRNSQSSKCADENAFFEKITMLRTEIGHKNDVIDDALNMLAAHSWARFVATPCHGDLTLENIIVKDNKLFLIDFLDSFYDCWILDISTLMQDVQTLWAYRFETDLDINTVLRLIVFRDILMDTVKKNSPDDYMEIYYALLLKLLRIIPYTHDRYTYDYLIAKIKSVMDIVRGESAS